HLAALRAAGVRVEDLEIGRADLEDVFVEIMQGGGQRPRTAEMAAAAGARA
ncbi:MAG: ABC transporter ATP-binding protein, partial [Rubrivivax sp.]|nr:ABC transporter ATP-binding protein [Rubrivivax sp.]